MENKSLFIFLIIVLCVVSCNSLPLDSPKEVTMEEAQQEFYNCSKKLSDDTDWITFDRDVKSTGSKLTVSYRLDTLNPILYIVYDSNRYCRIDENTFTDIDIWNNDIVSFNKNESNSYRPFRGNSEYLLSHIPFYFQRPFPLFQSISRLTIVSYYDTCKMGKTQRIFTGFSDIFSNTDVATKKHIGYSINECNYFIDLATGMLDSLETKIHMQDSLDIATITQAPVKQYEVYRIKNIDLNDKTKFFDSLFGIETANLNNLYEGTIVHSHNDSLVTNELMTFPLERVDNTITKIIDFEGWLLISLWNFNCPSCIKTLKKMGHEKDSIGYRILEKERIEILAVNYQSDNMDLIAKTARKTNTCDIVYSAKGISQHIQILPTLGYYYLVSPEKSIVWHSSYLGDYSELLEAKANYEKQHKSK